MRRYYNYLVLFLLIGFMTNSSFGQDFDLKKYRVKFDLSTIKQADGSRLLNVDFTATNKKDRKDRLPIYEAYIDFYNFLDDEEVKLGTSTTNKEGTAQLILPGEHEYIVDSLGFINLRAAFKRNGKMKGKEDEIAVKDLVLELNLEEVDSVKTAFLKAFELDNSKNKIPVEELDVVFSVGGMISKMPIEEATLEEGEYEFEFPDNISGDKDGNIDVFVLVEDHEDFGNVIQKKSVNWGTLNSMPEKESYTLWTDVAPIWMYVVLTILLVGVWANYTYSIKNLLKIKKEGKEIESKNTEAT